MTIYNSRRRETWKWFIYRETIQMLTIKLRRPSATYYRSKKMGERKMKDS